MIQFLGSFLLNAIVTDCSLSFDFLTERAFSAAGATITFLLLSIVFLFTPISGQMEEGHTLHAALGQPLTVPCSLRAIPRNRQVSETSWQKWASFADGDAETRKRRSRRHQTNDPTTSGVFIGSGMHIESIGESDDGLYRCSVIFTNQSPNEVDVSGRESNSTGKEDQAAPEEDPIVVRGDIIRIKVQGARYSSSVCS